MNCCGHSIRSELAKAKSMGSAKTGHHHWLMQRFSALLLILLSVWGAYFLVKISGADYETIEKSAKETLNLAAIIMLVTASLYHAMLGMQVVIEDYISSICLRNFFIITLKLYSFVTIIVFLVTVIYWVR